MGNVFYLEGEDKLILLVHNHKNKKYKFIRQCGDAIINVDAKYVLNLILKQGAIRLGEL